MKIYVLPKENYNSAYAILGTDYGSIDTKFKRSDKDEWTVVPEGIAHFLEHKLFESEDLDALHAMQKQALRLMRMRLTKRAIFFQCSDNFEASLESCLILSTHSYFTKRNR